jgi:hypothetical protein
LQTIFVFHFPPGQIEGVEQTRCGNDRRAVLVVMEHWNVE